MKVYVLQKDNRGIHLNLGVFATFDGAAAVSEKWVDAGTSGVWHASNGDHRIEEHEVHGVEGYMVCDEPACRDPGPHRCGRCDKVLLHDPEEAVNE